MISISKSGIAELLGLRGEEQKSFHERACLIRNETISGSVYIRGLIEFSNICINDCFYCGIRKSNVNVNRYELSPEEILGAADNAADSGLASIVLQCGERRDAEFISYIVHTLNLIKEKHPGMCITLSAGEQDRNVYREFFKNGAERYLLRIESSTEAHYKMLHPGSMSFTGRVKCLHDLREEGFQVGTGVMINSPFQTPENLADDILFFRSLDIDMCGMGPFIPHRDTPFGAVKYSAEDNLNTGLNMIAVLRTVMPDINIASTTALETLDPRGRELGLLAGANVLMPQFSPLEHRGDYLLYDNKPQGVRENRAFLRSIEEKITSLGLVPVKGEPGTSIHYKRRVNNDSSS